MVQPEIILFKSPTPITVKKRSLSGKEETVKITPYIYGKDFGYGGLGMLEDKNIRIFSIKKRNVFALWRTIQILKVLGELSVFACYSSAFHEGENADKAFASEIINKIGKAKYDEIMRMKIPHEIILIHLKSQSTKYPFEPVSFAEERKKGTIIWKKEYDLFFK